MKNRLLSLLFASILLSASCGGSGSSETTSADSTAEVTTAAVVETSAPAELRLAELEKFDFAGEKFVMLGPSHDARRTFSDGEESGEPVNDALYRRDVELEELFNVELEQLLVSDPAATASKTALAGEDAYQLVIGTMASTQKNLAQKKLCANLCDFTALSLDSPWWCAQAYENLTLNGKCYFTTSPITPQFYFGAQVMALNTRLAEEQGVEGIPEAALAGAWTLDLLDEALKDTKRDLNGDTEYGADDFYGMVWESSQGAPGFYVGSGQKFCEIDGGVKVSVGSEASTNLIERLSRILSLDNGCFDTYTRHEEDHNIFVTMFTEGRALFATSSMSHVIVSFREMTDDYVILPMPKLDASQESYHTYTNPWTLGGISVPITVEDTEKNGALLEAMACLSWAYVRPAQYDITLKAKVSRDETDLQPQLLDAIFDASYYDLNGIFQFGGTPTVVSNAIAVDSGSLASDLAAAAAKIDADIAKLLTYFE